MAILKSSRHSYVVGKFGEHSICNWLSRSGFEVTIVDHTGIDILAYHPKLGKRLGISVKSRTRNIGTETTSVTIFRYDKQPDDRSKLIAACAAFACEPWIAVYVETEKFADIFLTSLGNFDTRYRTKTAKTLDSWKMSNAHVNRYKSDENIKYIRINFNTHNWDW
ncbi:MAG: hypothetical protein FJW69_09375 [Actinobacteria bacterium]|nr:hypothetical protein [Actinomycetota bacterium]